MLINDKNLQKSLEAISIDDKRNNQNKKEFELVYEGSNIYFVLPKKMDLESLPTLSTNLRKFFKATKEGVDVHLESFVNHKGDDINLNDIVEVILWWAKFYEKDPFTRKTKGVIEFNNNIIFKDKKVKTAVELAQPVLEAQFFCRRMQDTPNNMLNAEQFVDEVKALFKPFEKDVEIKVLNKKDIEKKKMGLLLGVNAGSLHEPRLISIKYLGNKASKELVGYVGKGITFDTGGSSLKPTPHMRWMKFDMSGAAIVMSTLYALVKNKAKANVVAIAALTDNAISATAIRPDDILTSYNGMTVEIDNTDAEGRLILADAITYAIRDMKVNKIVDIATLTGAMIFSLGDTFSGVWSTSDKQWKLFNTAAVNGGENVWRLPFHDDFLETLKSPIADITNSTNDRRAGSSRAGCFLKEFTEGLDYIHLDVASTADVDNQGQAVLLRTLYRFASL